MSASHDFDYVTHRCKRCGLSYLALMGGGYVSCMGERPTIEPKASLTGDALWESIVDVARSS
jgi:hypothetical protein